MEQELSVVFVVVLNIHAYYLFYKFGRKYSLWYPFSSKKKERKKWENAFYRPIVLLGLSFIFIKIKHLMNQDQQTLYLSIIPIIILLIIFTANYIVKRKKI